MHPISDAVPATIAALLARQPLSPAKVEFAWRVTVGPAIARATEVELAPDGVLLVTTADRHWSREVESARALILARMVRLLGPDVVRLIVVRPPQAPRGKGRRESQSP